MAIYWPTPGFKGRTFKLCVLTRWDFNFCIRSSPLRGHNHEKEAVSKSSKEEYNLQALEMSCYRKILHISYKDHATNQEVHAKIQQTIGPHKDLLMIIKRCNVSCSSGLAKTILQGTVKGGRRQGRQRKRWEDNIREWTGLEFGKSQRAVENRGKWRKLVAKSSVVHEQPLRLRDWW